MENLPVALSAAPPQLSAKPPDLPFSPAPSPKPVASSRAAPPPSAHRPQVKPDLVTAASPVPQIRNFGIISRLECLRKHLAAAGRGRPFRQLGVWPAEQAGRFRVRGARCSAQPLRTDPAHRAADRLSVPAVHFQHVIRWLERLWGRTADRNRHQVSAADQHGHHAEERGGHHDQHQAPLHHLHEGVRGEVSGGA